MIDRILSLNGSAPRPTKRNSDFVTVKEAMEMNLELFGPVSVAILDMDKRMQAIERKLGIEIPPEPPTTETAGDIE